MSGDTHKGIIAWFARNGVAANLLMVGIMVMGLISAIQIKKEFFPEFSLNQITIRVSYRGAAPQEAEEGVCVKIEEAVQDLEGVKRLTSRAYEGGGRVDVEIANGYEVLDMLDKIKLRVDAISTFPAETEKPVIYEQTTKNEVMWVQIYGDVDERTMKEYGKMVRDEITALPEVTQAEMDGVRAYEISIEVSESTLRQYGLTFDQVVQAVRKSSLDLPAGSIKTVGGEILLRTKGQAYVGREFEQLVLLTQEDGTRLLLGDIARVVDGFDDSDFFFKFDGKPSLGIRIYRVGNQNALTVAAAVRTYIEKKNKELPAGISLAYWADASRLLKGRLNLMLRNMALGGVLVFISLAMFLRLRVAFWVMVGLPVCFLGAIWLMPTGLVDISINMITLFGFILVLGIVVDDAIVIGENVYTTIRKDGPGIENVIKGAQEVALPATFGVLTTIAAFLPMLMVPGPSGKMWSGIALVVILCLFFSLIESKLILPAHLAHMKIKEKPKEGWGPFMRIQRGFSHGLENFVEKVYRPVLELSLRHRYTTVSLFLAGIILSVGVVKSGIVRNVFFPNIPSDFIRASVEMAEGTPATVTEAATYKVEQAIHALDREMREEFGDGNGSIIEHTISWSSGETLGRLFVELKPSENRMIDSIEVVNRWREKVGPIAGAIDLSFSGTTGYDAAAIDFQLEGDNFDQLDAAAEEIKARLADFNGIFDIKDTFSGGKQEIQLAIKPEAEVLGLTLSDLARQVRQGFYGAEAQRIQRGKDEVRVMVRYPEDERRSLGDLENMRVRTPSGEEVPFSSVAEAKMGRGFSRITRINRKRVVNVRASVDKDTIEPHVVINEITKEFMPALLAKYPGVSYALEGESREQAETMGGLMQGFFLALIIIYALMAVPLRSYIKPLIIMAVIPFGIVGAIFGHLVLGLSLSILSFCGIVALTGVVVNDSLVMVDFITRRENEGMPRFEAIRWAGIRRFRPILLTSLTTFLGLTPMLMERSLQARFLAPMAVSLAFGILFATVITLILIPSLYLMLDDLRVIFLRIGAAYGSAKAQEHLRLAGKSVAQGDFVK